MSKSKGNIIDPLDLIDGIDLETLVTKRTRHLMQPQMAKKIEKSTRKNFPDGIPAYGTDALRFTFCTLASTGRHIRFDTKRVESNRNFCNKLWNAARFVFMQTEDATITPTPPKTLADEWIGSQLQSTITACHKHFGQYRFDLLSQCLYEFTWDIYCDWYLELSKAVLNSETSTDEEKNSTRYTLLSVLEQLLRLLHPLMPFITEEIWQRLPVAVKPGLDSKTIMMQPFPTAETTLSHTDSLNTLNFVMDVIKQVRTLKSEMNINPGVKLKALIRAAIPEHQTAMRAGMMYFKTLAKVDEIAFITATDEAPVSATTLVAGSEILIPMAGVIDKASEQQRTTKSLVKLTAELEKLEQKLSNKRFVDKAPAEVVNAERERLEVLQIDVEKLKKHQAMIEAL